MSYQVVGSGTFCLNPVSNAGQNKMLMTLMQRYDSLCAAEMEVCGTSMQMQVERDYQERKRKIQQYNDPFWWLTVVFKEIGFTEVDRNPSDELLSVELSFCNNYDKHVVMELLETLSPYTSEGCISYCGEEGEHWRHIFIGGEWTEQSGRICYDEVSPRFPRTRQNMERLMKEIRRQVIHDDRRYEDKAQALLKAFEEHDPDGVLYALSGRFLHEHGVAASIWPDREKDNRQEESE